MRLSEEQALSILHAALPRKRYALERLAMDEIEVYEGAGAFERGQDAVHDYRLRAAVQALSEAGLLTFNPVPPSELVGRARVESEEIRQYVAESRKIRERAVRVLRAAGFRV